MRTNLYIIDVNGIIRGGERGDERSFVSGKEISELKVEVGSTDQARRPLAKNITN